MLGSSSEADDAIQEAWLRMSRSDTGAIGNPGGWLTTVTARVCLDMLRARAARREAPLTAPALDAAHRVDGVTRAEDDLVMADAVGLALLVVLDRLAPPERIAFVLHDLFAVPFAEIAPIVGRSPHAARKLASRARQRVRGAPALPRADLARRWRVVEAFLAASREGDLDALLAVLDPDVVRRSDTASPGAPTTLRGARAVAEGILVFARAAEHARPVMVDGTPGLIVAPRARLRLALKLAIEGDLIVAIEVIGEPRRLRRLDLTMPSCDIFAERSTRELRGT